MKIFLIIFFSIIIFPIVLSSQEAFAVPTVVDSNYMVETVASGLSLPTTMDFLGPDDILVLQKNDGKVMRVLNGVVQATPVLDVPVANDGERGLLGIAIKQSPPSTFVYLYYTEAASDGGAAIANRVYRYTWNDTTEQLESPVLLLELPSTHRNHNGGVLARDLNGEIFAIIGDQNRDGILQNSPPPTTADDTSVVIPVLDPAHTYRAIGVRNSFGLGIDPITGFLWNTENGPSTYDEINLVPSNFNSGWKTIMGPSNQNPPVTPPGPLTIDQNGVDTDYTYGEPQFSWFDTNAPTAIAFIDSAPFFSYRDFAFVGDNNPGQIYAFPLNANRDGFDFSSYPALQDLVADDNSERDLLVFASGFDAITDIKAGPDGVLYVVSITQGSIYKIVPPDFLEIIGNPTTTGFTFYEIIVSDQITKGPNAGPGDVLSQDETTVNGKILPTGIDDYSVTGTFTLTASQNVVTRVNGVVVQNGSPIYLEVIGNPTTSGITTYEIIGSDQITKGPNAGPGDVLSQDETAVIGIILPTGIDDYSLTGTIGSLTSTQPVDTKANGVEVPNGSTNFPVHFCTGTAECIPGHVTQHIDGDTLKVDGESIRFALVNAPESGEAGGQEASDFIANACPVGSFAIVDEDDGQTEGSFGRTIAVVYCQGMNLNETILDAELAVIATAFCSQSEFGTSPWAQNHGCP